MANVPAGAAATEVEIKQRLKQLGGHPRGRDGAAGGGRGEVRARGEHREADALRLRLAARQGGDGRDGDTPSLPRGRACMTGGRLMRYYYRVPARSVRGASAAGADLHRGEPVRTSAGSGPSRWRSCSSRSKRQWRGREGLAARPLSQSRSRRSSYAVTSEFVKRGQ